MELKVWVEGIQRIVCGVTVNTTCQDVVFALAHATGKVGRFTLIERWRNNERLLAPNENPLKLLLKWGEYANDVQFILQRSENKQQTPTAQGLQQAADTDAAKLQQQQQQRTDTSSSCSSSSSPQILNSASNTVMITKKPLGISNNNNNTSSNILNNNQNNNSNANCIEKSSRELKKSFGAYDVKHNENIGIVKGIPQRITQQQQHHKKASPNPQQHVAQQQAQPHKQQQSSNTSSPTLVAPLQPKHEKSHSNPIEMVSSAKQQQQQQYQQHQQQPHNYNESGNNNNNIYQQLGAHNSKSINEINLAIVRESLGRRTTGGPARPDSPDVLMYNSGGNNNNPSTSSTASNENLLDIYNGNARVYGSPHGADPVSASPTDIYKNTPAISANGALVPPPYRDPPPPRNSPMQLQQQQQQQQSARLYGNGSNAMTAGQANTNPFLHDYEHTYDTYEYHNAMNNNNNNNNNMNNNNMNAMNTNTEESESIFQATQYNDLLQLIKFQREKISAQQMEMNEYDAEIVFLEGKERDQAQELEAISREITKVDQIYHQGSEQLQSLQYVEEENELVKQQEKTLKSEIALLRSKLSNCEMELLQCKNKIRLLMDDIEVEQRSISNKQKTNRQNVERDFLMEMERIQIEIDQAMHNADSSNKTSENLEKEIMLIENAIAEKKRQVEQLVNEMKEVNLQSLTVTTSEEIKHLLEGPTKPGSSRRIIGSPRQLENAVPTSKNPHGVWV